jgi:NAD(P)-dependent dehydrogenase (short-subunit alcohol dehydrogenase family)
VFDAEGRVDVLHNNAGIGHAGPVEKTTLEDWQKVIGVNLMGVVHGIHAFVPRMLSQGRPGHIVNTASLAGLVAAAEMAPYVASKHAVVGLSESLNAELGPRGLHVTALCPGVINTPIVGAARMRGEMAERHAQIQRFYERRGASPDEVAEAVLDAIRRRTLIRTVPRSHAALPWALRRLSPRAAQVLARHGARLTRMGG